MSDDESVDPFGMGFNFIDLFGWMKGKLAIPDGSRSFFPGAVEENFLTVEKGNLDNISVGEDFCWCRNNVLI